MTKPPFPVRITRELEKQPLVKSVYDCIDALASAGMSQEDIDNLKTLAHGRRAEQEQKLKDDGVCPEFNMEYAMAIYLWTIDEPNLHSFLNGHMHSVQERTKGKGGISAELRACLPFAKAIPNLLNLATPSGPDTSVACALSLVLTDFSC